MSNLPEGKTAFVTGMFLTSKYALPLLRESAGASVINFGSYDGYIADPGDIANLATWLASDEASFASGQCHTLDGGMTAASPLNPGLF